MTAKTFFMDDLNGATKLNTSSPKGNDAHLRAIIQSEKKMETAIFQTLKGSELCGPWSDLAKFQTHPSSYVCHHYP